MLFAAGLRNTAAEREATNQLMDLFEENFGENFGANRNLQLNPFDLKILKILIEHEQQPQKRTVEMEARAVLISFDNYLIAYSY